jgi:PIN domain nuclease of toxin-antitoxin system
MKFLLDTHLLLWAIGKSDRLPLKARVLIENLDNEISFSTASIWEIAIKFGQDRKDFQVDPRILYRGLIDNGYLEIPITSRHTIEVAMLPPIHRDPFDRLLVAQAIVEGITLLTVDSAVAKYGSPVRKI